MLKKCLQNRPFLPTGRPLESAEGRCYARRSLPPVEGVEARLVARGQLLTAEDLWTAISERLRGALNDTTFTTWFGSAEGRELSDEAFLLAVPNDFTREWIEGHFVDLIGAAQRDATGEERRVEVVVDHDISTSGPVAERPKPLPHSARTARAHTTSG